MNPNKSKMNNSIKLKMGVIRVITLLFMMTLAITGVNAQNGKSSSINIYPLDSYINSPKKNDGSPARLKSLVYEVKSSIYFYNGTVKTYDSKPECLFTDIKDFNNLAKQDMARNDIELITIRVENIKDFQENINLNSVSNFPKLKLIYILATFNYDINSLPKTIINNSDSYVIVFNSDKGA